MTGKSVSFSDTRRDSEHGTSENIIVYKKIRKGQACLCSIFFIFSLLMLGVSSYEMYYKTIPKEGRCVHPHHNLEHNPPEENECVIYTRCVFEKNDTEWELIEDTIIFLPKDYRVKEQYGKCPFYWELPGYHTRLDGWCDDKGYGCCEVPLDTDCATVMHHNNNNYAGYLYNKINKNTEYLNTEYLNIPKENKEGSNCPSISELLCETYHSKIYHSLIYIWCIWMLSLIFLCFINIKSRTCCSMYETKSYTGVSESV